MYEGAHGAQKESDPQEVDLKAVVNHQTRMNSGPLQQQQMLLTDEPSFQSPLLFLKVKKYTNILKSSLRLLLHEESPQVGSSPHFKS